MSWRNSRRGGKGGLRTQCSGQHRTSSIALRSFFFVAASRKADMTVHLAEGEQQLKLFFSMDRMKYNRLWPRYIYDMHDLRTTYPDTWNKLVGGSLSVSKNGIPSTSVGADHACEHLNRQIKVKLGLVGISNNVNARKMFFWLPQNCHACQ